MSDAGEWLLVGLEEKIARRQGVPLKIPVPKGEFEGLAKTGLKPDLLKKWITVFLGMTPPGWRTENAALATSFDRFLAKVDLWVRAQAAFTKQDFKTAISTLKLVANIDPDDHAAKMNLGQALANTGDAAGGLKHLEAVRETFQGDAEFHTSLGQLYSTTGNRDSAVDELVLALEAKPDHMPALDMLKQLGVLVAIYEDPRNAASLTYVRADSLASYLETVWDQGPRDAKYYLEQVAYHADAKRHLIALAAAERGLATAQGAELDACTVAKITALRGLGRTDEAIALARSFVARAPSSAVAHIELAQSLKPGDPTAARAETEEALRLDPGNLLALDLAFWPPERGDIGIIQKAIPALQAFAEAHADVAGTWRSLARAKLAVGATDDGLSLFAKATSLAKDDDDLRAEYWSELARQARFNDILADAAGLGDMNKRDWKVRWNEAEALRGAGKKVEARAAFSAINFDTSLHVDVRKRAKRAANNVD